MRYFCTLFDKSYLYQALALFKSLESNCSEFTLYALCMDDVAYNLMSKTGKANLIPVSLAEIETEESRVVKQRLNFAQYFAIWQPLICQYILDHYKVDMITYIDADIMFFNDPEILFKELDDYSVSVVSHNYTPFYENIAIAGKFCVQFNAFKKNKKSRDVLNYWKECCFEYSKWMPYNYPGQISLDYWPENFEGVRVIQHLGAGVAPWNIQQYEVTQINERVMVNGSPIVFYHFHQYAWDKDGRPFLSDYPLSDAAVKLIYNPYATILMEIEAWVHSIDNTFHCKKENRKSSMRERLVTFFQKVISKCCRERLRQKLANEVLADSAKRLI